MMLALFIHADNTEILREDNLSFFTGFEPQDRIRKGQLEEYFFFSGVDLYMTDFYLTSFIAFQINSISVSCLFICMLVCLQKFLNARKLTYNWFLFNYLIFVQFYLILNVSGHLGRSEKVHNTPRILKVEFSRVYLTLFMESWSWTRPVKAKKLVDTGTRS